MSRRNPIADSVKRTSSATASPRVAAQRIANTLLKLTLALTLGSARLRRLAGAGLTVLLVTSVITLGILW